jgi:mRNA interferase MazF
MNRGDIYLVNLDPTIGSEIKKTRPCVLMGATPINTARSTVVVIPLSSQAKINPPITVSVTCQTLQVAAVCDQIRSVDKSRLVKQIGQLSTKELERIEDGLRQVLSL